AKLASSRWLIALIAEAEKLWPHSSSVIASPCGSKRLARTSPPTPPPAPAPSADTVEQLGREPPFAVLWHSQLELADPRDHRPDVIARPVALPTRCPLALLGAQRLGHLGFEYLLQRRPHQRPQKLLVFAQKGFDVDRAGLTLPLGHGVHPRQRIR